MLMSGYLKKDTCYIRILTLGDKEFLKSDVNMLSNHWFNLKIIFS